MASVPPNEIHEILLKSTPAEITALVLKFNDLPPNGPTLGAMDMFFQAWAETDGMSALKAAFLIKDTNCRGAALYNVINSASYSLVPDFVAYLQQHPDKGLATPLKGKLLDGLLQKWSCIDPANAAKFFDELGDDRKSLPPTTASIICRGWASVDPENALSWAKNRLEKNPNEESLFKDVAIGWCLKDPKAAANYVTSHLEDPGAKDAVVEVAYAFFKQDPKQAATWLTNVGDSEIKTGAEQQLARDLAQRNAATAAEWVKGLPQDAQQEMVPAITGVWADQNWSEASKWIAQQNGSVRDQAIVGAITLSQNSIPRADALPLAASIIDPGSKFVAISSIVQQWAPSDPEAAAAWVKSTSLSKKEKQAILSDNIPPNDPVPEDQ